MKVEGLSVKEYSERKRESMDGKIEVSYYITLKNSDGDRVSVTTAKKTVKDLVVAQDVTLEVTQAQTKVLQDGADRT